MYRNGVPFAAVENAPIFPGCENASDPRACFQKSIQRHISKNFRYPQDAIDRDIQGRVSIIFLIDTEGHITNIAKKGPDASLENEAERIISRLPQMTPGRHEGKEVNVPFAIPITFRLSPEYYDSAEMRSVNTKKLDLLVAERSRSITSTTAINPVIINLDQHIEGLRAAIKKDK